MLPTEIYLDANATTPVLPAAWAAAQRVMCQLYGNPSSSHSAGLNARAMLDATRACAQRVLGTGTGRLLFTSGATESIQTSVLSALCAVRERQRAGEPVGRLLLYGATEHKAVPQSLIHWNQVLGLGLQLQALPVDSQGRHDLAALRALAPQAALVCTMAANNETGVVSDLAGIEATLLASASAAYWLVDCVQALGKLPLDLASTRIDYAAFSGHKLYAPKGVGMLYVREQAPYTALMAGGGQEMGDRAGTENMAGIAALGAVLQALESHDGTFRSHAELQQFRQQLCGGLQTAFPQWVLNAPLACSLPTTLNFSVPGLSSKDLLDLFDAAGLRVSAGSACSAGKAEPSDVLLAMQVPEWQASAAVRLSFGPTADAAFIQAACARIEHCGAALRASANTHTVQQDGHETALDAQPGDMPEAELTLAWQGLPEFARQHPHATLVDVREPFEHVASALTAMHQLPVVNLPLQQLDQQLRIWRQRVPGPLVFFCRSGKRSAKAAQCLRRLGFDQAWHLSGGLAEASAMTTTPAPHASNT